MNTTVSATLTENEENIVSEIQSDVALVDGMNRWSTAVRSWVDKFQQNRHGESLPAFDSSLKDALS